MEIHFATLDTCAEARGVVVVIDVVRAFSTAAYAFGAGADRILLAGTVEEALALRERTPGSLAAGEVGGLPVEQFDLWNSPSQMMQLDLSGRTLIQRTSAGTQGVVRSLRAEHLLAGSFVVAGATVRAIRRLAPRSVTFVVTGTRPIDPRFGNEDRACAEYMAALLGSPEDGQVKSADYLGWQEEFFAIRSRDRLPEALEAQFMADVELCRQVDRFPFAMVVHPGNERVMTMVK